MRSPEAGVGYAGGPRDSTRGGSFVVFTSSAWRCASGVDPVTSALTGRCRGSASVERHNRDPGCVAMIIDTLVAKRQDLNFERARTGPTTLRTGLAGDHHSCSNTASMRSDRLIPCGWHHWGRYRARPRQRRGGKRPHDMRFGPRANFPLDTWGSGATLVTILSPTCTTLLATYLVPQLLPLTRRAAAATPRPPAERYAPAVPRRSGSPASPFARRIPNYEENRVRPQGL